MTDQNCVMKKPDLVCGKILRNKKCAGAWEAEADEFWSSLSAQPSSWPPFPLGQPLSPIPPSPQQDTALAVAPQGHRDSSPARLNLQSLLTGARHRNMQILVFIWSRFERAVKVIENITKAPPYFIKYKCEWGHQFL